MRSSDFQASMAYTPRTERMQIPGMSDYRDEFNPSSAWGEFQRTREVPDDFYVPPALKSEFYTPSSVRQDFLFASSGRHEFTPTPTHRSEWGGNALAIPMPSPTNANWAHERTTTAPSSFPNKMSPSSWTTSPGYLQNNGEASRSHSFLGDVDPEVASETEAPAMTPASRRLLRQMSRTSMAGVARSSSAYGPKKTRSQKFKDYVQYEKGILESLLPLKAAVAATLASIIAFAPFLPDMLRYYGTTAVVGVGMTLEPTVGQTLQKGYNLALGSALAACCAFVVFKVEPYTGTFRVPFLILCAFLGGCLPRMYNLPAVIKSRWGQVVSYYISVFHGLVLWNPLTRKQTNQFLFNCMCYCIGFLLAFTMGLCVKPDYAGDALLSLLVKNLHTAGNVLERIVDAYKHGLVLEKIQDLLHNIFKEDKIHADLQFIMSSIPEADKLVTAVQWEPPHGKFYSGYPWNQYPKLLEVLLHVMYDLISMDSCLRGEIQAPVKVRLLFADDMEEVARECAELFHKIAEGLEQHKKIDYQIHVARAKDATRRLRTRLSKFSALVIAQDFAPVLYSRSTSINSTTSEVMAAEAEAVMAALAQEGGASAVSTPATPATAPASPQKSDRGNDQDLEGVPQWSFPQDNVAGDTDWRAELHRKQMLTQAQAHWDSVEEHWDETTQMISSLSFLKFASILVELMAKVKTVVAMVDDFAMKAHFTEDTTRH